MLQQVRHGRADRDGRPGGKLDAERLLPLALLLVAWAYFAWRIHASIAAGIVDNSVLGADAAEILRALQDGRYHGLSLTKHPLAVVWAAFTIAPMRLAGVDTPLAASLSFGLAGAMVPTLTFLLARLWHAPRVASLAAALLATTTFSALTVLSIVESYAVTLSAMPAALIAMTWLARHLPDGWFAGVAAGVCAAIAAWANLPLAALVLAYPALRLVEGRGIASLMRSGMVPFAVAGAGAIAPTIALGLLIGFGQQQSTISQWTSLSHFTDATILADYAVSVFALGAVAPDMAVQCRYPAEALASLLADPLRLAALAGIWMLVAGGVIGAVRNPAARPLAIGLIAIIATMLLFFLWFAPFAALLFAGQWWFLLVLLALPLLAASRIAAAAGLVVAALCLTVNAPVLANSPIDDFAASCPQEMQVNGGI